jgi:hypothetical protein
VRYVITLDTDTRCRATRRGRWSPRWRIRSIRATIRSRGASSRATACSRGEREPARRRQVALRAARGARSDSTHTRTVSDVYQDLFGEGSFIGKGIYDVDAFESALSGRFPKIESSATTCSRVATRSGLASDTALYEDDPASYAVDAPPPPLDPR